MRSNGESTSRVRGVAGVLAREERLLLIQRAPGILAGGAWCFPGGAIEPGETPAEALVREFREEVGLVIRAVRPVWQRTLRDGELTLDWWIVEPLTPGDYALTLNPAEVADARWLTPAEIAQLAGLLESNREFLAECAAKLRELP